MISRRNFSSSLSDVISSFISVLPPIRDKRSSLLCLAYSTGSRGFLENPLAAGRFGLEIEGGPVRLNDLLTICRNLSSQERHRLGAQLAIWELAQLLYAERLQLPC